MTGTRYNRAARGFALAVAGLLLAAPASAQIYKCEANGQVSFQDSPCPGQAKSTVIGKPVPPSGGSAPDLMPMSLEPVLPPPLDTSDFRPPASMSLLQIYNQLQLLGARDRTLRASLEAQMQSLRAGYQAALHHVDTRHQVFSEWGEHTRASAARARALSDEDGRLHRQFGAALRAITAKPLPQDPGARVEAMREREQAMARLHRAWDARLAQSTRAAEDAARAMQVENRDYQQRLKRLDSDDPARALKAEYARQGSRARARWVPRLQVVEARQKLLNEEVRRRCPGGASLSPGRQFCRQADAHR